MKKTFALVIILTLVFQSACGKRDHRSPSRSSGAESTSEAKELLTGLENAEKGNEPQSDTPAAAGTIRNVLYGKDTGTDLTYTGLEPLPPAVFQLTGMKTGLPTQTIEHSFGAATAEKPHEISIEAQKRFDEFDLDAIVYDNRTPDKTLYLTFDCGYDNGQTDRILDTLKEKNVKAAFFCTLPEMKTVPELTARMIREGHIVGNHSVTHPDFSAISHEQMVEEVKGFDDWLREKCGYSAQYFRFPMGKYSLDAVSALNALGYQCVFWALAYFDWDLEKQPGVEKACETVIERLHPGAVILLHAVSPDNAAALPNIIDTARSMGYEFKALNE